MSWLTNALSSTLGRKLLMAATGLFLITFLVVHLAGNLQLLSDDGGESFNVYAKFMTTNTFIKTTSYLLYATFLIHIIWAILLSVNNRSARPVGYKVSAASTNSTWSSRNMGFLGTIVFIFLVIHLANFWWKMKFGEMPMVEYDGAEYKDLYTVVSTAFGELWLVILYVVAMIGLMFHLFHGFQSAFQTLGLNHPKYNPAIKIIGSIIAIVIPALFASIPILMYLN
ncbi:succinate dehydrogenase cytochrome b subunit [Fulvivirga sedimenti]|uniref:Succinate dehydrogenase cytochrome b subunit n=1 Tax=Fulvivirga sedimenti TaxID=2879465 RepID=A0A9X1HPB7_9BACT|nr:succinate dehydrogenase cytochrome b subunit [Fulvivirga sedimenti]MCA6075341.1 succinate dehydrogenase cytochrome b subunit [Fulvivirga sedimenti]MCA6076518.1 succinate dehydrogenase cytochrome b subunit [Fulvivirga sedimenti]MCA6077646.1 succinate dehydrogenase cytochrome b subunit [Fulvivirga sedimenti]